MRVLNKKLVRDIYRARGQSAAVTAVILVGIASYITMASAYRNLLLTRDAYYQEQRFADFFISLERAPVTELYRLRQVPGVRDIRCRIVKDVNVDIPGDLEPKSARIVSMPDTRRPVLNDIVLLSGRYFDIGTANEAILSDGFAKANALEPGDIIYANINNRRQPLRIVGTALSPEYVYLIRNPAELVPSPERFGILWLPQSFAELAFDMQGACNDVVGTVDDPSRVDHILDQAETMLDRYGVFLTISREDQISNRFLSEEIAGLAVSVKIMPAIFLGVASVVLLVLLNRMVRQERTQIGLLKAYGYGNWTVSGHYLRFALVLGVAGCILGFILGQILAGLMVRIYIEFYSFPILRSRIYPDVIVQSMALSLFFAGLGAFTSVRHAVRIRPAEAMRPESPKTAHRTLLERAESVWRRLPFTGKMIARNVGRYKWRAALTIFGVAIAAGMLFIGWFLMDSMKFMMDFEFNHVRREDVRVALQHEMGKNAWLEFSRMEHVRRAEPLLQYPFKLVNGWRSRDVAITGLLPEGRLLGLEDTGGRPIQIPDRGVILGDHLANQLHVQAGDSITLRPLLGRITRERHVPVAQVVREYFGMGAYMHLNTLSRLLEEPFAMNAVLLETAPGDSRRVNEVLRDLAVVTGVEVKEDAYENIRRTLAMSMRITNIMTVLFAGVIAFAIIYNSTMVSLAERQRELASMRVLGFSAGEVGRILYLENLMLSAVGLVLGIPLGIGGSRIIITAYETDLYRLPFKIGPRTYVYTLLFTVLFVIMANLTARRKVIKLDMVEVLKERE
ncbi:MAG: FtsX-like permease family protein [Candidatus Hydrogenedentes bacterium]|nr:FtsX-like permease family protein [Candidatus Hydrogenedentota bacterium]